MTDEKQDREDQLEGTGPQEETGPGLPWRLAGFLGLLTVVIVFAVQNTQTVELNFLGWTWDLPLVIVILVSALVAVILDEVLGGLIRRRRRKARQERAELERLRRQE